MTSGFRQLLKDWLPAAVNTPLRRTDTYLTRLAYWARIVRGVRGEGPADSRALWAAFASAPLTALSGLDAWQDPALTRDARILVPDVGAFDIRAGADDLNHVFPGREPEVFGAIKAWLRPGDVFVDAGANIGFYTLLGSRLVGPQGRVVAVEMMPDTAAILRKHVAINSLTNVEVLERALSDHSGDEIEAWVEVGKFGQASTMRSAGGVPVAVRTATLDEVLAEVGQIRLMKMDLEGAERSALMGARSVLTRIDAILFEVLPDAADAGAFLRDRGFVLTALDGRDHLAVRPSADPGHDTA